MPASNLRIKYRQFSPSSLNTVIDAQNTAILYGSAIFYVQAEQPNSFYREEKLQSTTMEEEQENLNLNPTLCDGLTSLYLSLLLQLLLALMHFIVLLIFSLVSANMYGENGGKTIPISSLPPPFQPRTTFQVVFVSTTTPYSIIIHTAVDFESGRGGMICWKTFFLLFLVDQ
ncbi:hypothetical protein OIU85_007057 [Salix viminalis]|uniref:Uncharacterized protein n=1 Tax=Salix viminalis TaxID=40686 RepID=A0A9Q0P8D5_SALVM|nr:hypothetical protein OIU85_007057 [Salix viminalis]